MNAKEPEKSPTKIIAESPYLKNIDDKDVKIIKM